MASGAPELSAGNSKLVSGSSQLSTGADKLVDGNARIAEGTGTLYPSAAAVSPPNLVGQSDAGLALGLASAGAFLVLRKRARSAAASEARGGEANGCQPGVFMTRR